METFRRYQGRADVVFLGLTGEGSNDLDQIEAFVQEFGMTWPNGYGAAQALKDLGVRAFPTTLVYGRDGTRVWDDEMSGSLESAIERALAAGAR